MLDIYGRKRVTVKTGKNKEKTPFTMFCFWLAEWQNAKNTK